MQELFDGFYSNKGLQYLIDKTRELFNRPLVLYDTSYKVLAASYDADSVFQFVVGTNGNRFVSESNLSFIPLKHITEEVRAKRPLGYIPKDASLQGTLYATIKIDVIEVAHLVVYEADAQFQDIDFKLIDKVSALFSAQLQRNILMNLDHNQLPSYILVDLIEGKPIDDSILNNRQVYLKWARTENIYILVISYNQKELLDNKISVVLQTFKSYIPIDQCIIYKSSIIAFIDQILYDVLFNVQDGTFQKFLENNDLYAGVSREYSLITESKKHYQNAVKAMEIGQKRNLHCSFFEDCTLYILSELVSNSYDMMDFCHPAVSMLMAYDKEKGSDYLKTLRQYIFYSSTPAEAARVLNIHKNTLFYRIGKIKDMTGIRLEYGDEICKVFLSIRLLEIKGVISL